MKKTNVIIIFLFYFIFISTILLSQLPEWKFYRDRDGNNYFIDKNGKIWTPSEPVFDYKAVSIKGISFYLSHAKELIRAFHYSEGLTILKSILALPLNNNLIRQAQIDAVNEIKKLQKNNGKRFNKISNGASIILFKKKDRTIIINDLMKYELFIKNEFKILRKKLKIKYNYKYQGITIGVQDIPGKEKSKIKYKYLIAMDSEIFSKKVESVELVEKSWRSRLGYENFKKKKIIHEENRIIYLIENKMKPFIKGYEGFFVKGKYSHIVRIITSRNIFGKNDNYMNEIIANIKLL